MGRLVLDIDEHALRARRRRQGARCRVIESGNKKNVKARELAGLGYPLREDDGRFDPAFREQS